jgi:hypothetical protein
MKHELKKLIFSFLLALCCFCFCTGQITYSDSCLTIGFFYKVNENKYDTSKTIKLKESTIQSFFSFNKSLLNLVVAFKNNCNQSIATPSSIRLDMPGQDAFSIEGYRIDTQEDTLEFNIEYDYFHSTNSEYILKPKKTKFIKFSFPLGFNYSKKGRFKFRLRFYNEFNYIPIDQWKYYYSNWIYLIIK